MTKKIRIGIAFFMGLIVIVLIGYLLLSALVTSILQQQDLIKTKQELQQEIIGLSTLSAVEKAPFSVRWDIKNIAPTLSVKKPEGAIDIAELQVNKEQQLKEINSVINLSKTIWLTFIIWLFTVIVGKLISNGVNDYIYPRLLKLFPNN